MGPENSERFGPLQLSFSPAVRRDQLSEKTVQILLSLIPVGPRECPAITSIFCEPLEEIVRFSDRHFSFISSHPSGISPIHSTPLSLYLSYRSIICSSLFFLPAALVPPDLPGQPVRLHMFFALHRTAGIFPRPSLPWLYC